MSTSGPKKQSTISKFFIPVKKSGIKKFDTDDDFQQTPGSKYSEVMYLKTLYS